MYDICIPSGDGSHVDCVLGDIAASALKDTNAALACSSVRDRLLIIPSLCLLEEDHRMGQTPYGVQARGFTVARRVVVAL